MLAERGLNYELPATMRFEIARLAFSRTLDQFIGNFRADEPINNFPDLLIFYRLKLVAAEMEQEEVRKIRDLREEERTLAEIVVGIRRGKRGRLREYLNFVAHDIVGDPDLEEKWTDHRRYKKEDISNLFRESAQQVALYSDPFISPPNPWDDNQIIEAYDENIHTSQIKK